MLISPLNAFPWVLNGLVESWVSLKRVQAFLEMTELDFWKYYLPGRIFRSISGLSLGGENGNELLSIVDGNFTWKREERSGSSEQASNTGKRKEEEEDCAFEWQLDGVNLTIRKVLTKGQCIITSMFYTVNCIHVLTICFVRKQGEFVGITGKVGSGKSSLLSAITAEMRKKRGQVWQVTHVFVDQLCQRTSVIPWQIFVANLGEGFALVSQESWIQFASVRDNILFGLPYDSKKYGDVIHACALEPVSKLCFSIVLNLLYPPLFPVSRIYKYCPLETRLKLERMVLH